MEKAIHYALKQLELIGAENGFTAHTNGKDVYIEFPSGKSLVLSYSEVLYQANEYLESEIRMLKF